MIRWDDLWLNEGFSQFIERSDGNYFQFDGIFDTLYEFDSYESSYPISMEVNNRRIFKELFNDIVYIKVVFYYDFYKNNLNILYLRVLLLREC